MDVWKSGVWGSAVQECGDVWPGQRRGEKCVDHDIWNRCAPQTYFILLSEMKASYYFSMFNFGT